MSIPDDAAFALVIATRLFLSVVLGMACLHKLREPMPFFEVLRAYRMLPGPLVPLAGAVVIAIEAALAIGLQVPALVGAAGIGAALLLGVYAAAIAANLARGRRDIDCGCSWGRNGQPISWSLVARNAVMIALCLGCAVWGSASSPTFGVVVVGVACAAGLLLCHRAFETLVANVPALDRLGGTRA